MVSDFIQVIDKFSDIYSNLKKNKELKKVLKLNLYRELKYNIAIFDEMQKTKKENIKDYVGLLKLDFYAYIKLNLIDIKNFIEEKQLKIYDLKLNNKNFIKWIQNTDTNIQLIEKIYFRIEILKSLAQIKITKRKDSYQYLKTLMLILKEELKNDKDFR